MRNRIVGAGVAVSLAITACAAYIPIASPIAPGRVTVRFSLTDAARSESFGPLGAELVSVEGEVRATSDSAVTVAVTEVGRVASDNEARQGETVTIPTRFIGHVEQKRIQVARSVLFAGALAGAVIWIGLQAGHGSVVYRKGTPPPTPGQ
jgi:hypothetical protein